MSISNCGKGYRQWSRVFEMGFETTVLTISGWNLLPGKSLAHSAWQLYHRLMGIQRYKQH